MNCTCRILLILGAWTQRMNRLELAHWWFFWPPSAATSPPPPSPLLGPSGSSPSSIKHELFNPLKEFSRISKPPPSPLDSSSMFLQKNHQWTRWATVLNSNRLEDTVKVEYKKFTFSCRTALLTFCRTTLCIQRCWKRFEDGLTDPFLAPLWTDKSV